MCSAAVDQLSYSVTHRQLVGVISFLGASNQDSFSSFIFRKRNFPRMTGNSIPEKLLLLLFCSLLTKVNAPILYRAAEHVRFSSERIRCFCQSTFTAKPKVTR